MSERIKQGTIRADGKVFYQYLKGREYWMPADTFRRIVTIPAQKRKAAMLERRSDRQQAKAEKKEKWESDMAYWAATREQRKDAARKKMAEKARIKRLADPDFRRESERRYLESKKNDPEFIARRKLARDKYTEKLRHNPERLIYWGMRVLGSINRERGRVAGLAIRDMDHYKARVKREAAAKSRDPRIILTPEQRIARRRVDRKNHKHRRRALLRGMEAKATSKQISEIKKLAKGRCFYCRAKVKVLTLDHIVALSKGGGHTVDNIVFACHVCNSEKRDLDPAEYAKKHGMLLV